MKTTAKEKRTYPIEDIMEAVDRTTENIEDTRYAWWNDEWTSEVIESAISQGFVLKLSPTHVKWTDKGIEEMNKYFFRPLNNGYTAVFQGITNFSNPFFLIYKARIKNSSDLAKNTDKRMGSAGNYYVLVDETLHSATSDLEPSAPVKEEYQLKKEKHEEEEAMPAAAPLSKEEAIVKMIEGETISVLHQNNGIKRLYSEGKFIAIEPDGDQREFNVNDMSSLVDYQVEKKISVPSTLSEKQTKLSDLDPDDTFKFEDSDTTYVVISSSPEQVTIRPVHGREELNIEKNGKLAKFFSADVEIRHKSSSAAKIKL